MKAVDDVRSYHAQGSIVQGTKSRGFSPPTILFPRPSPGPQVTKTRILCAEVRERVGIAIASTPF